MSLSLIHLLQAITSRKELEEYVRLYSFEMHESNSHCTFKVVGQQMVLIPVY